MDTIKLTLSGTLMSGFSCVVPRAWALQVSHEELITVLRIRLIDLFRDNDMYVLTEQAKNLNLHIHASYNNQSSEIYICECSNTDAKSQNDI